MLLVFVIRGGLNGQKCNCNFMSKGELKLHLANRFTQTQPSSTSSKLFYLEPQFNQKDTSTKEMTYIQ